MNINFYKELLKVIIELAKVVLFTGLAQSFHENLALVASSWRKSSLGEYEFDSLLIDFGHNLLEIIFVIGQFKDHVDDIRAVRKV